MDQVLHSSARHDWETPEEVLELVRRVGPIVLDPCTTRGSNPTGSEYQCHLPDADGLLCDWDDEPGLVYVNSPFGRELPRWIDKAIAEAGKGCEIILLAPSRTDTKWFRRASESCQARCLWYGRMRFKGAPASAPFPTALWYWTQDRSKVEEFRAIFNDYGEIYGSV